MQEETMKPPLLWNFTVVFFILSCTEQTGQQAEPLDIDGVPIVRTEGGPKYEEPLFRLESDLILGIDEGEPEWQMFSSSPRPLIAPDGRMVLVDIRRFEIYIISQDGQLMCQLGGRGSGPGEFENILDVFWAEEGKEFWLTDQRNSRITRFSIDGVLLGNINYSAIRSSYSKFYYLQDHQFLAEGPIMDLQDRTYNRTRFALLNDQLEVIKELFELEGYKYFQVSERGYAPVPFTTADRLIPLPDGRLLHSQPNYPRLSIYSTTGDLQYHIERDWDLIPVTQEEKSRTEKGWRESGMIEGSVRIPFPKFKPPFIGPYLDTEGRIWLRMFEPIREEGTEEELGQITGYEYEIFGSDGVWLGTHIQRPTIRHITSEYLYQTYSSEAGSPRLERLRIVPLVPEMKPPQRR